MNTDVAWRWGVKPLVFLACLVPLAGLVFGAVVGDLGANPLETVTDTTGIWGLRLLLVTLAITPLRHLGASQRLLRLRRMLGLFAFFYVCLHFLTWIWIDQEFRWVKMLADIAERPYITVGFTAWLLLVPLAVTSTRGMMRRLGRSWKRLHRVVYLIASLGTLHFLWSVKADWLLPLVHAAILVVLLLARVPVVTRRLTIG